MSTLVTAKRFGNGSRLTHYEYKCSRFQASRDRYEDVKKKNKETRDRFYADFVKRIGGMNYEK